MSNSDRVQAWRKRAKAKVVAICGGKCNLCGYDRLQTALEFHHLDPSEKDFSVTGATNTKRLSLMIEEVRKCILVCANCHREIHGGLIPEQTLLDNRNFNEQLASELLLETEAAKLASRFNNTIGS